MSERFSFAHAGASHWEEAASSVLAGLGGSRPENGLGFVYTTDAYADALPAIHDYLREGTGVDHWLGTVGLGICASGREYFDEGAMAVMIADLPAGSYRLIEPGMTDAESFSARHGDWARRNDAHFAVIHGDPRLPSLSDVIAEMAESFEGFFVGGLTSSRASFVQLAGAIGETGISGALISQDVAVATALTQSCSPIGKLHEVTECEENIAFTLDGRPALDVFTEDIGEVLARDLRQLGGIVFAALPVRGSDTGDYLVRDVIGFDTEQGLIGIGEALEPGTQILFVRRDRAAALTDLERMLGGLKRRAASPPKGALYYSCLARGPNLFGPNSEELRAIEGILGDVPLVGFFGNGEISHDRLYTYTGVLTLFL
ncbi:MAG: FIST C-terminal domain-containing protein [Proteobacteria bacterium]|nr:FIST C-terminal domain-containing protein [Pseudomonadota bacterium]